MDWEYERMWQAVAVVCFKVMVWHSPRFMEEEHKNFQAGSFVCRPRFKLDTSQIQGRSVTTEDMLFGLCSHCHNA